MENQHGFIKLPILLAVIVGILILGGAGYFGVKQYQNYYTQKVEQDTIALEKEKEAQAVAETQQKALERAQTEIETLKQEGENAKAKQQQLEQTIKTIPKPTAPTSQEISSTDLAPFISSVGVMWCGTDDNSTTQYGTGVLLKPGELMTNWHVIEKMDWCRFSSESFLGNSTYDNSAHYRIGAYIVDLIDTSWPNIKADFAVIPFHKQIISSAPADEYLDVSKMNYSVGTLKSCSTKVAIGTPVAILGYPASSINLDQWWPPMSVTNGIVSGYESVTKNSTSDAIDYIVSAKVDHGNSGGLALGKESGKVCLLGIPTWVVTGQAESAGIVQNIHNLLK